MPTNQTGPNEKGLRERRGKWEYRFQYKKYRVTQVTQYAAIDKNIPLVLAAMAEHKEALRKGDPSLNDPPSRYGLLVTTRLDKCTVAKLEELAANEKRTRSNMMRVLLEHAIAGRGPLQNAEHEGGINHSS